MKKLLWTGALALTAMACLTACGDDSSTSAGGDELYTCDVTDKKVVVNQNAGDFSIKTIYTHNEDGTMTVRYEYGSGHKNVCDGPMPTDIDEDDAELTCKDNVVTIKTHYDVTAKEFKDFAFAAAKACEDPALSGKETKPSDDDDDDADDEENGSDDEDVSSSSEADDPEAESSSSEDEDDDGDEGGKASDVTCNFDKSDDTWNIAKGEGGGEMVIKWNAGKAVTVTKTDMGDAETCQMMLDILATDTEGSGTSSCDGGMLLMEDPDTYSGLSRNDLYEIYCAD